MSHDYNNINVIRVDDKTRIVTWKGGPEQIIKFIGEYHADSWGDDTPKYPEGELIYKVSTGNLSIQIMRPFDYLSALDNIIGDLQVNRSRLRRHIGDGNCQP